MSTKRFNRMIVLSWVVGGIALCSGPFIQNMQAALLWSTTFPSATCPEWSQLNGLLDNQVCAAGDGISGGGSWTTELKSVDQITAAANNPGGNGGLGLRHWRGGYTHGINNNGGGLNIALPASATEVWIRWYMRFQSGFRWANPGSPNYTKDLYFNPSGGAGTPSLTVGFHGSTNFGVTQVNPVTAGGGLIYGSPGWTGVMGGDLGDGVWHYYEVHLKMSTGGLSNGVAEVWVDGTLRAARSNLNWGSAGGFNGFLVGSNQREVWPDNGTNAPDFYTDYDDLAASITGYIGGIAAPAAPTNLRITP